MSQRWNRLPGVAAPCSLIVALFGAGAGFAAAAAEPTKTAFNAAVVSDYVFRGFSQTDEQPALQLGADLTSGAFYAGAWGSNVDFGDATDLEVDAYGGVRGEALGYAWDVGVVGYFYPGQPNAADYDYAEVKLAGFRAIGPLTLGAAVYYSPDYFGVDEAATYIEANAALSPADKITFSGAIGRQALDVSADYTTWSVGVAYALTDRLAADVRYHDTDVDAPLADARVAAGLKLNF